MSVDEDDEVMSVGEDGEAMSVSEVGQERWKGEEVVEVDYSGGISAPDSYRICGVSPTIRTISPSWPSKMRVPGRPDRPGRATRPTMSGVNGSGKCRVGTHSLTELSPDCLAMRSRVGSLARMPLASGAEGADRSGQGEPHNRGAKHGAKTCTSRRAGHVGDSIWIEPRDWCLAKSPVELMNAT